jgi:hypothetical protein
MKSGDIVFVRGNSLISWLIKLFDHGQFSHVAIAVSDNEVLEAEYNTKTRITPFYFTDYEIVDLGLSTEQMKRVEELAPKLVGYKYDFMEIISIFVRNVFDKKFRIWNSPQAYICSELVEFVLSDIGVIPKDKDLRNITPNELRKYLNECKCLREKV